MIWNLGVRFDDLTLKGECSRQAVSSHQDLKPRKTRGKTEKGSVRGRLKRKMEGWFVNFQFSQDSGKQEWSSWCNCRKREFVLCSWINGQPMERSKMRSIRVMYGQFWELLGQGQAALFWAFCSLFKRYTFQSQIKFFIIIIFLVVFIVKWQCQSSMDYGNTTITQHALNFKN